MEEPCTIDDFECVNVFSLVLASDDNSPLGPTDVLLQFEAAEIPEHEILSSTLDMTAAEHRAHVPAQDDIGTRIWIRAEGDFEVDYRAEVRPCRQLAKLETLQPILPHDMPGEAVQYLFDSRYCPADKFQNFVEAEFGGTTGGARGSCLRGPS